jgi:dTDP-4-amino-4,6-dideoxygalactose transaminase
VLKYPLFKVRVNSQKALHNIADVFTSGYINEGEQVIKLQSELKNYLKVRNLTLVNSGTSALTLALRIIGIDKGDEVITTAMTCVATNTAILNSGAKIVWADIDIDSGMISAIDVERKITNKTKAIMVVNWAGTPCDLAGFDRISKRYNIPVIQDAAHSFGAYFQSRPIADFTNFTCYSFQAIKHFTTGDGGAIVCRSDSDAILARKLKWFGYDRDSVKDAKGDWKGQKWDADIEFGEVGYKFNMNNLAAAVGLANISEIHKVLQRHRENASHLREIIKSHERVILIDAEKDRVSSYWVYTLRLNSSEQQRNQVLISLNSKGIGAGLVHLPNYLYSAFKEFNANLPNTVLFSKTQLSLPCGWWLDKNDIEFIAIEFLKALDQLDD